MTGSSTTAFGWAWADPIAALVVACVVVYVSWRLARQTIDALLDAAPPGVRAQALNRDGTVPNFSNRDSRYVDIAAPGESIF